MDEIASMIYRYAAAFDSGDVDAAIEFFTEDAVFHSPSADAQRSDGRPHDPNFRAGGKVAVGREAILGYLRTGRGKRTAAGELPRHLVTNLYEIEGNATEKTVQSSVTFLLTQSDGSTFVDHCGVMIDKVVKVDGRWLFREHRVRIDSDQNFPGRPPEGQVKRGH